MHPSYFLVLNAQEDLPKREFVLSAEVSEWLFYKRLWDEFNQKHETQFAQYEEEVLQISLMSEMVKGLRLVIADSRKQSGQKTQFRYGWNEKKEELICVVENKEIVDELSKLIIFLEEAFDLKSDVYCQL